MTYTQKDMDRDLQAYIDRMKAVDARTAGISLIHEESILFDRIDTKELSTFLATDPKAQKDNVRLSWYGRVLQVSAFDTGDDIKNAKKKAIKVGDIISFNTEVPFSLNIDGFYSIWVLSVENVIGIDNAFNPIEMKKAQLLKRVEIGI